MQSDDLIGHTTGEVYKDGKVLIVRRIHVRYDLRIDPSKRALAERVRAMHADYCPVARSIEGSIDVTTEVTFV